MIFFYKKYTNSRKIFDTHPCFGDKLILKCGMHYDIFIANAKNYKKREEKMNNTKSKSIWKGGRFLLNILCFILIIPFMLVGCATDGRDGRDGKDGRDGTNGRDGVDGTNGLSAYELAVRSGYLGTEKQWLDSLVGADGKTGADGKSAYDIAIEFGYSGTKQQWLNSLKGENGKDAYALAVENGFEGTVDQWLLSLVGKDGNDGKSAYELAKDAGFAGDVTAWLASLVGKNGTDGKSAYDLAKEVGFEGTLQEWLDTLVGASGSNGTDGKSAFEIAKEEGFEGTKSDWLESLKGANGTNGVDGVGISKIEITDDNEFLVTFTNGSTLNLGSFRSRVDDQGNIISETYVTKDKFGNFIIEGKRVNLWSISATTSLLTGKFYSNGSPYESDAFASLYNATEKIYLKSTATEDSTYVLDLEIGKTYRFQLVPPRVYDSGNKTSKSPWSQYLPAGNWIWFYDANDTRIDGNGGVTSSNNNLVTIPAGTVYFRFQVDKMGFSTFQETLSYLNSAFMITEGVEEYSVYYAPNKTSGTHLSDDVQINGVRQTIYYNYMNEVLNVNSHFDSVRDIGYLLQKKGPNSIFDFNMFYYVSASLGKQVSDNISPSNYFMTWGSDAHGPFVVSAVNNADGDNKSDDSTFHSYFTGGNHGYLNTGTISTENSATGRTANLKVYVDNKEITSGNGYCNQLRVYWENYVQAYNTTKADGSGREVLKEVHEMIFDGYKWEEVVDLIPLEDIKIDIWYGFQAMGFGKTSTFDTGLYFKGATDKDANRKLNESGSTVNSGSKTVDTMVVVGSDITLTLSIDKNYDLGSMWANSESASCFSSNNKLYFNLIRGGLSMEAGAHYGAKGSYCFAPTNTK